ncbi:hypothetical protein GCM10009422_15040 [Brevundimonas kwangchunensis]|uniref:Uncharacterized protein n=1 Tax=Brevundimonas kwangchunensis TaxID=322163 RepID=A0ABN1GUX6_9CAUL
MRGVSNADAANGPFREVGAGEAWISSLSLTAHLVALRLGPASGGIDGEEGAERVSVHGPPVVQFAFEPFDDSSVSRVASDMDQDRKAGG